MPTSNSVPNPIDIAEFAWLATPEASHCLAELASSELPLHTLAERLRRKFSRTRSHLLLEQSELRRRAAAKFTRASEMLFTPRLLEQATDEWISRYKANRFGGIERVADLCCGAGGDLIGLAAANRTTGIDLCETAANCSRHNLAVYQSLNGPVSEVNALNALLIELGEFGAWHIDPDRRPHGKRTTRVELHEPSLETIERMLSKQPNAAIKLAPASDLPKNEAWTETTEFEWISRAGECRQLVAWRGALTRSPSLRRATNISAAEAASFVGQPDIQPSYTRSIEQYLFEPGPAVRAAHLTGSLANQHALWAIAPGVPYFTGPSLVDEPLVDSFVVQEVMPFDRRSVTSYFRQRGVGRLEIKHRGLELDPDRLRADLRLHGDDSAVLMVTKIGNKATAIVAQRVESRG